MIHNKRPVYLLAGGRSRIRKVPDPLIQAVFRESGTLSPTIAYVGTANDDDEGFFKHIAEYLRENGARRVNHALISPAKMDLQKAQDVLKSADIVFISGGDVERGMEVLNEKNMTHFLFELYKQGKPFFGLSAGSIMLAREWVRWRDPNDDSTAELFPCLGLAGVICDTHDEQDSWQELQTVLKLGKKNVTGYGIPTGTAIKVSPDGKVEALGGAVCQYVLHGAGVHRSPDMLPVNNA